MADKKTEEIIDQGNKQFPDIEISEVTIKNLIYVVRGQQVMIDSDLAMLYQVETKVFNQAVKRNIERFPEKFRFQITREEFDSLRSQIVTSNGKGGRRYMPYVFTEQGIAMLSAVLRSEPAVQVSRKIMDAFVEMRRFFITYQNMKNHHKRYSSMDRYMMHSAFWLIWYQGQKRSWYW